MRNDANEYFTEHGLEVINLKEFTGDRGRPSLKGQVRSTITGKNIPFTCGAGMDDKERQFIRTLPTLYFKNMFLVYFRNFCEAAYEYDTDAEVMALDTEDLLLDNDNDYDKCLVEFVGAFGLEAAKKLEFIVLWRDEE